MVFYDFGGHDDRAFGAGVGGMQVRDAVEGEVGLGEAGEGGGEGWLGVERPCLFFDAWNGPTQSIVPIDRELGSHQIQF